VIPSPRASAGESAVWLLGCALLQAPPPAFPRPELHPEVTRAEIEAHVRFLASDELAGRATGTPEAERAAAYLADVLARSGVAPAGDAGTFLQAVPLGDGQPVHAFNVVGRIDGVGLPSDAEIAKEAVVVSAHYDHLPPKPPAKGRAGEPASPEKPVDRIYNGADDDASGCAAVLEIAGALGSGPKPARTVIFLLATGEEEGLIGTDVYIEHPVVPLESTVANLNVEMIGRPDPLVGGAGKVWLTGFDATDLGKAFEDAGLSVKPDPRLKEHFYQRSDNYAFVLRKVIGQTFSSYNMHKDYHTPADEAEKIDYAHMEGATKTILEGVRLVTSGKLRPHWAKAGEPKAR